MVETTRPTSLDVREEIAIRYLDEEGGRAFVSSIANQVECVVHRASGPLDHRRFLRRALSAFPPGKRLSPVIPGGNTSTEVPRVFAVWCAVMRVFPNDFS